MEFDCKIGGVKYTGIELLDVIEVFVPPEIARMIMALEECRRGILDICVSLDISVFLEELE